MEKETENVTKERKMIRPSRALSSRTSVLSFMKKPAKNLPENFFEKVLDLELKLKRHFTMEMLQELVSLYSIAIEFYESIEDYKYKDYQNRLNILLTQPDILKKMNDFYMNKGGSNLEKEMNSMNYARKLRIDQEKKQIVMKVNYNTQFSNYNSNNDKVQKIMDTIENTDEKKEEEEVVKSVINEDITHQQDNFKIRLAAKRRESSIFKQNALTPTLPSESSHNKPVLKINGLYVGSEENENNLDEYDGKTSSRTKKTELTDRPAIVEAIESESNESESDSESDSNSDCSYEHFEKGKMEEIEKMYSPIKSEGNKISNFGENSNINVINLLNTEIEQSKDRDVSTTMFKINENLVESKHIGPKHKQMFLEIKDSLEHFVNDFNYYFYGHVYQRFTEHIQKLMEEKYLKYTEISKNYHYQIKEMEFLITGDSEESHKDGIRGIVETLKEEQDHELGKIDDHFNKLISDAQASFKNFGFRNNPGIQLIEEKFKLDMYNHINMILLPKK